MTVTSEGHTYVGAELWLGKGQLEATKEHIRKMQLGESAGLELELKDRVIFFPKQRIMNAVITLEMSDVWRQQ